LPYGIEEIPKSIYVTSDSRARKTKIIKEAMIANSFKHKDFNVFLGSQAGRRYFHGIVQND